MIFLKCKFLSLHNISWIMKRKSPWIQMLLRNLMNNRSLPMPCDQNLAKNMISSFKIISGPMKMSSRAYRNCWKDKLLGIRMKTFMKNSSSISIMMVLTQELFP